MARTTATQRILRHIQMYGIAESKELQDKYDVTQPLVSQLVNNPNIPITKLDPFIIQIGGQYKYWSDAKLRSKELQNLIFFASLLREEYQATHAEIYLRYSKLCIKKAVACLLDIYLFLMVDPILDKSKGVPKPEPDADTISCDRLVEAIRKTLATGNPHIILQKDKD